MQVHNFGYVLGLADTALNAERKYLFEPSSAK